MSRCDYFPLLISSPPPSSVYFFSLPAVFSPPLLRAWNLRACPFLFLLFFSEDESRASLSWQLLRIALSQPWSVFLFPFANAFPAAISLWFRMVRKAHRPELGAPTSTSGNSLISEAGQHGDTSKLRNVTGAQRQRHIFRTWLAAAHDSPSDNRSNYGPI